MTRPEWLRRRAAVRHLARWVNRPEVRRIVRRLQVARFAEPDVRRMLPDRYFIKEGYISRSQPEYTDETGHRDVTYQPDVYRDAGRLAGRLQARSIVDIGCGDGQKLVALHPRFGIIGIDFGENLARCRDWYSFGSWRDHNLDTSDHLPLSSAEMADSLLVAADIIEHLRFPEHLLLELRLCLDRGARAAVISTPERDLTHGVRHFGPPPNPCHVREWAVDEFRALLAAYGFHRGTVTMTRSSTGSGDRNTILATLVNESLEFDELGEPEDSGGR